MKTSGLGQQGIKKSGNIKMSFHPHQVAADIGGKENLVRGRRVPGDNLKLKDATENTENAKGPAITQKPAVSDELAERKPLLVVMEDEPSTTTSTVKKAVSKDHPEGGVKKAAVEDRPIGVKNVVTESYQVEIAKSQTTEVIKKTIARDNPETSPRKLTAEDLTSEQPSEKYWEVLAEQRRLALEDALEKNKYLHEKVQLLEEENATLKELVADTAHIVQYINEIAQENGIPKDSTDDQESEEEQLTCSEQNSPTK